MLIALHTTYASKKHFVHRLVCAFILSLGVVTVSNAATVTQTHDHEAAEEAPTYYWGNQPAIGRNPSMQCALKVHEANPTQVTLEALTYLAHDQSYVYSDELTLTFDAKKSAYVFQSQEPMAPIKQAVLFVDGSGVYIQFANAVLHGNHYDSIFCKNLEIAEGANAKDVATFFAETLQELNSSDHDHDDHDHDDHDHEHDHDHQH